jgi:DNA-binding CsgD family transcriptional regulator
MGGYPAAGLKSAAMKAPVKSAARTLASIRQLCCLNLPEELFMPRFLEALKDWLPVHNSHFYWADPKTLQPSNYCGDGFGQMGVIRQFVNHTSQVDHPGLGVAFPEIMRHSHSGTFGCEGDVAHYLKSDMYGEVMQPFDGRYVLYLVLRDVNQQPRGLLSLLRHPSDKAFSQTDQQKLLQLEPYLRHAFSASPALAPAHESRDAEGMAVLDKDGLPRYQDAEARRLLWLASHDSTGGEVLIHLNRLGATPQLARLRQRLVSIFEHRDAQAPVFTVRNRWGRFVFRGSWLDGAASGNEKAIGVTITHYIPRVLKAWKGLHRMELAPRQQQVALLYSEGRTLTEIAAELNISRHTAADYVDVIYARLAITPSREALQEALLN